MAFSSEVPSVARNSLVRGMVGSSRGAVGGDGDDDAAPADILFFFSVGRNVSVSTMYETLLLSFLLAFSPYCISSIGVKPD